MNAACKRPLTHGRHPESRTTSPQGETLNVLIVPGLGDSGPSHWQTWLQRQYRDAKRVHQLDWHRPDLSAWALQIDAAIGKAPRTRWIAVAHSFGCLALAHYLEIKRQQGLDPRLVFALLVAPASPTKFELDPKQLSDRGLGIPSTLVASEDDPWMSLEHAAQWAERWGSRCLNLGAAGHINAESGLRVWPLARYLVDQHIRYQQRLRRIERAHPLELSYAI